jgi:hypothetical protein
MGGCNQEDGAMDDIFVLHLCLDERPPNDEAQGRGEDSICYFYWEKVATRLPSPRFHFGASAVLNDMILVAGGLDSTEQLLSTTLASGNADSKEHFAFSIDSSQYPEGSALPMTKIRVVQTQLLDEAGTECSGEEVGLQFGHACCTLMSRHLLLTTGGVPVAHEPLPSHQNVYPLHFYWVFSCHTIKDPLRIQRMSFAIEPFDGEQQKTHIDFASMVHHSCIPISQNSFLLIGGGVPSFSFGEEYAESHHLEVDISTIEGITHRNHKVQRKEENASPKTPSNAQDEDCDSELSKVIFVQPKDAKQVKTMLQKQGWLDKRLRMTKTTCVENGNPCIAIPITVPHSEVKDPLDDYILDCGELEMPYSTSQFASKKRTKFIPPDFEF